MTITLSCGHQIEDMDYECKITVKSGHITENGYAPSIEYRTVCHACAQRYAEHELILHTDAECDEYLNPSSKFNDPTKLFIDCEWNSFGGELISMALVSECGRELYEEVQFSDPIHPWVAENVMPKLVKIAIPYQMMQLSLAKFLAQFNAIHIVADWPEDIARFCAALIVAPGQRLNTPPLTMEIVRLDSISENPHNALADARGLMECYTGIQK